MATYRFIVAASALLLVNSCGDIQTVLAPQEKSLDVSGLYERQFHSTLYFPKGEALHYPGYVLAIEKSPRNIVGGPVPANRIADPNATYIQGEQSHGLARSTKELIQLYEDGRKSLFVSHIIKYDQPAAPPHGKQKTASKETPPPRFIDQCFVYNAFESEPVDASGKPSQLNRFVAWPHCGSRPTESPESVHTLSASGAPLGELSITGTQFQEAGETDHIYLDDRAALKKLECGLTAQVNAGSFTHLIIIVMGWNTSQDEAIRNFNDIVGNMMDAATEKPFSARFKDDDEEQREPFRPLVLGVTWPSYWNKSKLDVFSYFDKADDADELGLTWLNVLVNRTIPLVLAQAQKDANGDPEPISKLRVVLIGHSFGARAAMRAVFSGPVLDPPAVKMASAAVAASVPDPMIDLVVGLEGAVSVNRFMKDRSSEGAPYRDFAQIGTKIVLTASDKDEATNAPVWYEPSGSIHTWNKVCSNAQDVFQCWYASDAIKYGQDGKIANGDFTVCPANPGGKCVPEPMFPKAEDDRRVLYVNTSEGITTYNTPDTGGGAHSDIYRLPMGRLLWTLTETYAHPYTRKDDGRKLSSKVIADAQNAARECQKPGTNTFATQAAQQR
jgi:hypothetical protein